jgi:hypothetical protein
MGYLKIFKDIGQILPIGKNSAPEQESVPRNGI